MKSVSILIVLFVISGCCKRMLPTGGYNLKDSMVVKQIPVYHDTIIAIKPDTVAYQLQVPCPQANVDTIIRGEKGSLFVQLKHGKLNLQYNQDSLLQRIKLLEYQLTTEKYHTITVEKPVNVVKYKVPKILRYILIASLILNVWVYRRLLISLIKSLVK